MLRRMHCAVAACRILAWLMHMLGMCQAERVLRVMLQMRLNKGVTFTLTSLMGLLAA
jgi:hypothetical protein